MPAKLSSKRSVNYRVGSGRNVCGNCTMFKAPAACTAVEGTISAKALCNLFKPINDGIDLDDAWTEEAREASALARQHSDQHQKASNLTQTFQNRAARGAAARTSTVGMYHRQAAEAFGKASDHFTSGDHEQGSAHMVIGNERAASAERLTHEYGLSKAMKDATEDDVTTDAWSEEARAAAAAARAKSGTANTLHPAVISHAGQTWSRTGKVGTDVSTGHSSAEYQNVNREGERLWRTSKGKVTRDSTETRVSDNITLHDTFIIDAFKRTRDGYLAVSAKSARSGIQIYKGRELGKPHMDNVRVYRPENQVFATDAMHSMAHRPVTLKHPPEMVDSTNWEKYAVGHTGDEVTRDGQTMRVPLVLMDAAAIDAVEKKGQRELSWGYTCNLDFTPGTTDSGEPYDAVQTTIRANHLAIVPMARAGSDFRIGDDTRNKEHTMKVIMIDGVPVSVEDDRDAATITKHISTLEKRCADQQALIDKKKDDDEDWEEEDAKKTKDAKAVSDAKDGEIVALKKQLADSQAELAPAALDARLSTRQNVKDAATKIMGAASKAKFDGKTDAEIKRIVAASKLGDAAVKDMPDAAIDGVFTAYSSKAAPDSGTRPLADAFRHQVENVQVGDAQDPVALRDAALASRDKDRGDAWKHQPNNGQQRTQ